MDFEKEDYVINLDKLKARLFDDIMDAYLDEEDSCPNYEWVIGMAVSTITNIQTHGQKMEYQRGNN